jgi:hypothetical protein
MARIFRLEPEVWGETPEQTDWGRLHALLFDPLNATPKPADAPSTAPSPT